MKMKMNLSPLDSLFEHLESPGTRVLKKVLLDDCFMHVLDDLALLKAFLMDPPQQFLEDGTLEAIETLTRGVGYVISSFDLKKMNEDQAVELGMQLFTFMLLMPVRDWKYEAQLIYEKRPKPSRIHYPVTGQLVFIDHLADNLEELVKDTASSTRPLNHFILRLQRELQLWSSRLMKVPEPRKKDLKQNVTNLAYEVEYAIDSFQVGDFPIWHCMFWLVNILKEFIQVGMETTDDDGVVGFKAETERMLELLIAGPNRLRIISIVATVGQGKTTLAKKLYNDPLVDAHFHTRAWCCVSQAYEKREVLLELLDQVVPLSHTFHHKNDAVLAEMLYTYLKGHRFLIFLDDIWKIDAWNDLARCFPNDNNGSRIVFTTRIQELASQAKCDSILQPLCPLSYNESWELLRKKLFHKEVCPPELLGIGRQIAENCKGLPLSIVTTARLLAKMEKKVDQWEQIAETLRTRVLGDAEAQIRGVIDMSYKNLPDHLKPCFLYCGAFLEDKEIPVWKLIQFWIAEGFIKHTDLMSLEDVAEHYLMDLIGRSLITVAQFLNLLIYPIWRFSNCWPMHLRVKDGRWRMKCSQDSSC